MRLIYPIFEIAYGKSIKDDYSDDVMDVIEEKLEKLEHRSENGFINFDDVEELVFDEFTSSDKNRLRKYIIENMEE